MPSKGVLRHDEAAARMPNEHGRRPRLDCTRRHCRRELIGDLVGPFAVGGHDDLGVSTRISGVKRYFRCALWPWAPFPNEETSRKLKSKRTIRCLAPNGPQTPILLSPPEWRVRFGRTLQLRCADRGYGNEVPRCCPMSAMSDCSMCPLAFTSLRKFSSSAFCPFGYEFL